LNPGSEPPFSSDRVKHLEFIQAVVTRLGNNSFLVKGWGMTLAGAFIAFSVNKLSWKIALAGLIPVTGFWLLDSYFLRQERLFRKLYNDVRKRDTTVEVFDMNHTIHKEVTSWASTALSHTMLLFYGPLVVILLSLVVWGSLG
jgi:hypothetical protein